jgi:hypothetical protein
MKLAEKQLKMQLVGSNKMIKSIKHFSILATVLLAIPLLFLSKHSQAEQRKSDRAEMKIEIKCLVELYGGKETLYFAKINKAYQHSFAESLIGEMMTTPIAKGQQRIYKATECIPLNDDFSTRHGQEVDKHTVR